jgi:hypothetical protein
VNAPGEDREREERRNAAEMLQTRVALVLLAEARRRGGFGDEEPLVARAAELSAEMGGDALSPGADPPTVTAHLGGPDRIGLSTPTGEHTSIFASLGFDGILYEEGASVGLSVGDRIEPEELDAEQRQALARLQEEARKRRESELRFTASRFVRAIAAPPQPGAAVQVLAVQLFEDGFYVDSTFDKGKREWSDQESPVAGLFRESGSEVRVEDDLGTEYVASGNGSAGGVRVCRATRGFAPAPPAEARVLRITTEGGTVELDLQL